MNPAPLVNAQETTPCPKCGFQLSPQFLNKAVPRATRKNTYPVEEWIPVLEAAAREVFEIMLGTQLDSHQGQPQSVATGLTAMVGLAGELSAVLSVRCTEASASRMASKMLGMDCPEMDASVRDALGEICNMVAGSFKSKIPGLEEGCALSVPSVISGADYHLYPLTNGVRLQTCLAFEQAPLWVTLDLDR